ncbi:uncharacterized protein LOC133844975 [Drosophila sulfurigaster albostrigata]|uniref:uncharacterized protein LOC133844975 n=1 Tax=Drosophila sulfurigaster albostrigata TaxID=89887 RepID=UPI002D21CF27|nr:uncharacterized protein LOC133844975 [Drosophila sulfurigaster albostrigata]
MKFNVMGAKIITYGLLLGLFSAYLSVYETAQLKMTNVICKSENKSLIYVNECRLRAINRNITILNLNISMLFSSSNILLDMQILKKANGYKPWIVKTVVDVCKFVKKFNNPILKVVYTISKEYSNLNHSCPYMGYQLIKGFHVHPKQLHLPFPTGDYLLTLKWIYDKRFLLTTDVYFSFTENIIDM